MEHLFSKSVANKTMNADPKKRAYHSSLQQSW